MRKSVGRPAKFDRAAAVETVMNTFWLEGYEASSVKSISEKLGITRSSFYNAFESREALFLEALECYRAQSPDRALALAEKGISIKQLFTHTYRAAVRARIHDNQARGCLIINSVTELCNAQENLGPPLEKILLGSSDRITELLNWAVEQGELPEETDTKAMSISLQSLLIGINVMSKALRDEGALWAGVRTTLQALGLWDENFAQ